MTADSDWAPGEPDETWTITPSEVEAQAVAQRRVEARMRREGTLADLDLRTAHERVDQGTQHRRDTARAYKIAQKGNLQAPSGPVEGDDPLMNHLRALQGDSMTVNPSRLDIPPGEGIIEVVGPLGAEGYGITRRVIARGPDTGKVIYER